MILFTLTLFFRWIDYTSVSVPGVMAAHDVAMDSLARPVSLASVDKLHSSRNPIGGSPEVSGLEFVVGTQWHLFYLSIVQIQCNPSTP